MTATLSRSKVAARAWTPSLVDCVREALGKSGATRSSTRGRICPEYADDPLGFCRDMLGDEPWESARLERLERLGAAQTVREALEGTDPCGQADLLREIAAEDFVAVVGSKGPGKTWALARAILWWLHTRPGAIVVTVATTGAQLALQLWGELETALDGARHDLGGRLTWSPVPLYSLGSKHFAVGLSPKKPESIQGWHAQASKEGVAGPVLVIVDECSGVDDAILDATFGLLTNPGSKMVWSSNAKRATGRFHELYNPPLSQLFADDLDDADVLERVAEAKDFKRLRITAYDAPDWIVSDSWILSATKRAMRTGPPLSNPNFRYDVVALFPTEESDALFPRAFLQATAKENRPVVGGRHVGIDLGRHGRDPCIAILTQDGTPKAVKRWSHQGAKVDLMRSAHIIRNLAIGNAWDPQIEPDDVQHGWDVAPRNVHIDATGLGWGVVDRLWEMGLQVDAVDFGLSPNDETLKADRAYWRHVLGENFPKLKHRRDSLYWLARRCLEEGFARLPEAAFLAPLWDELEAIQTDWRGDQFKVASKDSIIEVLGRSPDYADAWACQFSRSDPAAVRLRVAGGPRSGSSGSIAGVRARSRPRSKTAARKRARIMNR